VDRRNAFQAQAKIERLLLVDAVIDFDAEVGDNFYFWGKHAFDGRDETVGSIRTKLIASCWRPSDLQAFDRDAQSKDQFVPISPSERACALSHISAWEGVRRSLERVSHKGIKSNVFERPDHVMRLFHIAGFASGKAILIENESMFPAPVCIVMEDDAILAERFVDRLHALLKELPRDFHFCSLGYSRPKTAPIIPFSTHLGIPTCIWYLTGYILSLEGAKFLQQKLPVQGPIDSWIGLRMCANFENDYGQEIGDLRQILKFRAFAALSPLCSQRVQNAKTNTKTERHGWRHRDTDIEYSGV
jgi:GR25 family glycosyltransferase involved in LPS biosynthesis